METTDHTRIQCFCLAGLFCAVLSLLTACHPQTSSPNQTEATQSLTIHVAASLADVAKALSEAFIEGTEESVHFNIAGSGALAQQIMAAPRGHLFLSANRRWLQAVVDHGNILPSSVRILATNQLAVVAARAGNRAEDSSSDLCDMHFDYLCIGDPAHVPAGAYAKAWLEASSCGTDKSESLWERYEDRLLPATDVRAALAQALAMRENIAIVYYTDYLAYVDELICLYRVPLKDAPPIAYYAGTLTRAAEHTLAREFLEFLETSEAVRIFEEHGFGPPPTTLPPSQAAL